MESYPRAAVERTMKVQEVILRAVAKKITWAQAGEVIGLCERQMRRWKERYEEFGYDGLFDRRLGKPSPKRVPLATVEEILRLYQEQYADFNVRHFHEKLREQHGIRLSYTCVNRALQMAGLVKEPETRSAAAPAGAPPLANDNQFPAAHPLQGSDRRKRATTFGRKRRTSGRRSVSRAISLTVSEVI